MNETPKNENDGTLPRAVRHQINEHTVGGYLIFYFNQNTGKPEKAMSFDSPAHAIALQKHATDWLNALDQVNLENNVANIQMGLEILEQLEHPDENPPEDDEDEED